MMPNFNIETNKALLEQHAGRPLVLAQDSLQRALENPEEESTIAIKILSVFGGLMASLAFCGFLFVVGFFNSNWSILSFGLLAIAAGITIPMLSKKIVWDTSSAAFYAVGFICFGIGSHELNLSFNSFLLIGIAIAILTIYLNKSYLLTFLASLQIIGFKVAWMANQDLPELVQIYIAVLSLFLCYLFLQEGRLLTGKILGWKRYYPIRSAVLVGTLALLFSENNFLKTISNNEALTWLTGIVVTLLVAYMLYRVSALFQLSSLAQRLGIAAIALVLLAPTLLYVPIAYSILIFLLGFYTRYKTGFVLGLIAFIYFMAKFYYDLNYTLLHKSILLISSGILFLICYLLIYKKLETDEKI